MRKSWVFLMSVATCMLWGHGLSAQSDSASSLSGSAESSVAQQSSVLIVSSAPSLAVQSSSASSDGRTQCYEAGTLVEKALGGQVPEAEQEQLYRRAAEQCPSMAEASYNLGVLLLGKKNYESAIAALLKAIQIREDARFRSALGTAFFEHGQLDEAERQFARVLEADARSVVALQGQALVREQQGNRSKALDLLARAREVDDANAVTWFNTAVLYDREGQLEAAVQAYERAATLSPGDATIQLYLGRAYKAQGDAVKSQRAFERAVELRPDEAAAHVALGAVYDSQGDPERAERALRRAVEAAPLNGTAWINLALVQLDAGRPDDALRSARSAGEHAKEGQNPAGFECKAAAVAGWALLELGRLGDAEDSLSVCGGVGGEGGSGSLAGAMSGTGQAQLYYSLSVLRERQGRSAESRELQAKARILDPALRFDRRSGWNVWR